MILSPHDPKKRIHATIPHLRAYVWDANGILITDPKMARAMLSGTLIRGIRADTLATPSQTYLRELVARKLLDIAVQENRSSSVAFISCPPHGGNDFFVCLARLRVTASAWKKSVDHFPATSLAEAESEVIRLVRRAHRRPRSTGDASA